MALVSKIVPDANLFEPPARRRRSKVGRPAVKGKALPSPCEFVKSKQKKHRLKVCWYGGNDRNVELLSGNGGWFKSGKGLEMIRWVYVADLDGTHRDKYFTHRDKYFSSGDMSMSVKEIIETYGGRQNIETTFQELRDHLGNWFGKECVTFSDMIISVRHHLWCRWVLDQTPGVGAVRKLPISIRALLHFGLTQVA